MKQMFEDYLINLFESGALESHMLKSGIIRNEKGVE